MEEKFTKKARWTMAIVALVMGIFGTFVIPVLVGMTFNQLMEKLVRIMVEDPHFELAPRMLSIWYIAMLGITFVASVTLFAMVYPLSKGRSWAWPVALSCLSLPTIFSVIEVLPFVVQFGRPPPTIAILLVSLTAFMIVLFSKKGDGKEKTARFFIFTLLGVVAGHINVLTMHGFKGVLDWPSSPLFSAIDHAVYAIEAPTNLIAMLMCILAIPLLASQRKIGWWLALIAGGAVILVNYPTHFIRLQTSDFFVAGTLGLALVVCLLIPAFRKQLLTNGADPLD